jgi:hypothetical protein
MPLLQLLLAATGVVTLIVICHRRGFRGDSPGMDLATLDTAMGADGITALAKERLVPPHCPQIWETYEPNPRQ